MVMSDFSSLVRTSVIMFDLPFMINLPDDAYEIKTDDTSVTIYLNRTRSPPDMPGLPRGVQFPPDAYVKGDKLGRFNYTKIKIAFHYEIFIKPGIIYQDYLLAKSVDIVNNILEVCRGVKGDHYIRINDSDIFSHELTYLNPEGKVIPGGASAIGGQIEIGMGGSYEPTQKEVSTIKTILSTNTILPLFQSLLFDAYDSHFYRNYRTAIVELGTAFEVFIYGFIRTGYLRLGKTRQEIENIVKAPFKNLLCDHIRILTGNELCNTNEYKAWNTLAYEKRNEIVHRGGTATDVDSSKAADVVMDIIRLIQTMKYG